MSDFDYDWPTIPANMEEDFAVKDGEIIIKIRINEQHIQRIKPMRGNTVHVALAQGDLLDQEQVAAPEEVDPDQAVFPEEESDE